MSFTMLQDVICNYPKTTGVIVAVVLAAIWLYFEIKNAPNIDDWD